MTMRPCSELRGLIDYALITIKPEEYSALLTYLSPPEEEVQGRRTYSIHSMNTDQGGTYRIATVRLPEQGNIYATKVTSDLIADLDPNWILLVGIGGAFPSSDIALGDVVLAARVLDFSVSAALQDQPDQLAVRGYNTHAAVSDLLSRLPGWEMEYEGRSRIGRWWQSVRITQPAVDVDNPSGYYGNDAHRKKVQEALKRRFGPAPTRLVPRFLAAPIASGNSLVKDADLAQAWRACSRELAAVEMEAAGVFEAALQLDHTYPVLAIRGVSDVVGFYRDEGWTLYACHSAAAFAIALLRAQPTASRQDQRRISGREQILRLLATAADGQTLAQIAGATGLTAKALADADLELLSLDWIRGISNGLRAITERGRQHLANQRKYE